MIHRSFLVAVALQLLLLAMPLTLLSHGETAQEPSPLPALDEPEDNAGQSPAREDAPAQEQPVSQLDELIQPEKPEKGEETSALPESVRVKMPDGTVEEMGLEQYLWGVVAAEMPAAFEPEALKAQAVAARSYTLWQMAHPGGAHPEADICTDFACCQAWISREERLERWPEDKREEYAQKITDAVESTAGEGVYSGEEHALTVFHASSAGQTRSALAVWGEEIPYLVSVDSPEGEQDAPNYYSVVNLTEEQVRQALEGTGKELKLSDDPSDWFSDPQQDDSGAPGSFTVGGAEFSAQELRGLFGLRSATFTVEWGEGGFTFYVTGYGHGVGMSQYGANVMAKQGSTYQEILQHYYPGTQVR